MARGASPGRDLLVPHKGEEARMLGSDAKRQLGLLLGSFGGRNSHVGAGLPHPEPKPKRGHSRNANKALLPD